MPDLVWPQIAPILPRLQEMDRESSLRPLSKMLAHTAEHRQLDENQQRQLIELCFAWLIGNHKVATKAHAMTALFHLGRKTPWIHRELMLTLEHNYHGETKGYQARARKIFAGIKGLRKADRSSV